VSARRLSDASISDFGVVVERLGVVMAPDGSSAEEEGVLNPAFVRASDGERLLYARSVARGNISRIERARIRERGSAFEVERLGFALEPEAAYELRPQPGYGCEDPRVTFLPVLGEFLMTYTAFGPQGPRVALAHSKDARVWERVGLVEFGYPGATRGDDKDAAFFPEPVVSPTGVRSLAFYHRPMLHLSTVDAAAAIPLIQKLPYADRESIRIAYVPLEEVLADRRALLDARESVLALSPDASWGSIRLGGGTPPVSIAEGWMSLFHGVDLITDSTGKPHFQYRAGIVIHDRERPHRVLYRSPSPVLAPESELERHGMVDNVVFPTGIDVRADIGERTFDIYYGMADFTCGAFRLVVS
jgi:beta-1,2-mannobiose phosphorylase / 1,2-beta-oligomannan phosphorylase